MRATIRQFALSLLIVVYLAAGANNCTDPEACKVQDLAVPPGYPTPQLGTWSFVQPIVTIARGDSALVTVRVVLPSPKSSTQDVFFARDSGDARGVIVSSLTLTGANLAPGSDSILIGNLKVWISSDAVTGNFEKPTISAAMTGSGSGGGSGSRLLLQGLALTITIAQGPSPDFTLRVSPSPLHLVPGAIAQATVSTPPIGSPVPLTFSVTAPMGGFPQGFQVSINPSGTSGTNNTLSITVPSGARPYQGFSCVIVAHAATFSRPFFLSCEMVSSWYLSGSGQTINLNAINILSLSQGAIAVGDSGQIVRTTNAGSLWTKAPVPFGSAGTLRALSWASTGLVWVVGDNGILLKSTDGGASWIAEHFFIPVLNWTSVIIAPARPSFAIVAGEGGAIEYTTNSGTLWNASTVNTNHPNWHGLACSGSGITAYVVGDLGFISKSTDGGATWNPSVSNTTSPLRAIASSDAIHCIAVGDGGTVVTTGDGNIWVSRTSTTTANLKSVAYADRYTVYAVGDGGVAICSFDEGLTWSPMTTGTATNLAGVSASQAFNLAAGEFGAIFKVH